MSVIPSKLYIKGVFLGYRRSKVLQNMNQAIIKINGVNTTKDAKYYFGKRVAYVYKVNTPEGQKLRCMWGKVATAHGTNGKVRCIFKHPLPPNAMGQTVRVMLYPNRV